LDVKNIGTGAYGVVCSAIDRITGRKVAIKKVPNIFGTITVTKQTLREVKILRHFHHPNIIAVLDIENIYIVLNLMETDLHRIIHSAQPLTDHHVRFFMYQILRALKYIHSANIIHRDLKPSNIMVNANCQVKIGDFGMARSLAPGNDRKDLFMTQYVSTRWYRAPEILFSLLDYSYSVDVWSVGCIFGEILNRRQLFPGKDHVNQIKLIIHHLGTPSDDLLNRIPSDIIKRVILSYGTIAPVPWRELAPNASPSAIALLSVMLKICPWERTSVEKALGHPYLSEFRDEQSEITCEPFVSTDSSTQHIC
ncbi:unnamed protein product, partial [Soboliphyme baturini]|uniref:Protein kinase domain-containing protein n=1 Tax=Soboliphyme baturini TaxID=241478 RepID=A0A183IEX2_9BILA